MRLRGYLLITTLGVLLGACAEPTGTESGNPSLPGANTPVPKLPPVAPPPLPELPVQPSPTILPPTESTHVEVGGPESSQPPPDVPTASHGTTEEVVPTQPTGVDGTPGPVAGTAGMPTVEGPGATHPAPAAGGSDSSDGPDANAVDAGDAGGVDAGP